MPNIINLRLLENKNIIAELNGIPLAQENSYRIIAGEENATQFKIASKPSQYIEARYTVEMVNAQGFGVEETDIIQDTFALPKGMAVAGYGFVQIKAYQGKEVVPFMTLKVKVWNTLPNWKEHISDGGDIDLSAYQKKTDNSLETESKEVVGAINELNSKVGQGGGSQLDVQINGTSIVENGVANIPPVVDNGGNLGLVKTIGATYGIRASGTSGLIFVNSASKPVIKDKGSDFLPIVPQKINYAVKAGLVLDTSKLQDGIDDWNEDEKAEARKTIGASEEWSGVAGGEYTLKSRLYNQTIYLGAVNYPREYRLALYTNSKMGDNIANYYDGYLIALDPQKPYHTANKKYVDENKGTKLYVHEIELSNETHNIAFMFVSFDATPTVKNSVIKELYADYILSGYIEDNGSPSTILYADNDKLVVLTENGTIEIVEFLVIMGNESYEAVETIYLAEEY